MTIGDYFILAHLSFISSMLNKGHYAAIHIVCGIGLMGLGVVKYFS